MRLHGRELHAESEPGAPRGPRVLMVGAGFPPYGPVGGYELSWQSFASHLTERQVEWRVLTTEASTPVPDEAHVWRRLKSYKAQDGSFPSRGWRDRLSVERHNTSALVAAMRRWRPDVAMFWVMGGLSMSLVETVRRAGVPSVAWVCDFWPEWGPGVDAWNRAGARLPGVLRRLDRVPGLPPLRVSWEQAPNRWIFVSEFLRHRVVRALDLPEGRTCVVHSPVADVFFAEPTARSPWRGKLLVHGRMTLNKGVDVALRALEVGSTDLTLSLVGPVDPTVDLQGLAERLGVADRVSVVGPVPRSRMPAVIAGADAVVFPVRWAEPLGLAPLEAMALRRPVVMTATGGASEYARDGENCLVVDVDDPPAVAAAVATLAADDALRQRLVDGGRATAERFREDACNQLALAELLSVTHHASP